MDENKLLLPKMHRDMLRIRKFEQKLLDLTNDGEITGFVHLYLGEEAVAVGVCSVLGDKDYISSTHRGHGHLIAKGGKLDLMMAELFQKSTGYCKGKGGSMHIADLDLGILGANGIVGAGPPIAVGASLTQQYLGTDNVTVSFFGDGASNQGTIHEAMNLASVWDLPIVFVGENNRYAEFSAQAKHQKINSLADRAAAYNIPGISIDGNDVMAVRETALEAVARARQGKGPTLIECNTFRIAGHYVGDPELYRTKEEIDAWKAEDKDPILRFETYLVENKISTREELEKIHQEIDMEMEKAVEFAEESPDVEPDQLLTDVYAE